MRVRKREREREREGEKSRQKKIKQRLTIFYLVSSAEAIVQLIFVVQLYAEGFFEALVRVCTHTHTYTHLFALKQ